MCKSRLLVRLLSRIPSDCEKTVNNAACQRIHFLLPAGVPYLIGHCSKILVLSHIHNQYQWTTTEKLPTAFQPLFSRLLEFSAPVSPPFIRAYMCRMCSHLSCEQSWDVHMPLGWVVSFGMNVPRLAIHAVPKGMATVATIFLLSFLWHRRRKKPSQCTPRGSVGGSALFLH